VPARPVNLLAPDFKPLIPEDAPKPEGTLFILECDSARDISFWSQYPEEKEMLLPPNTQFSVATNARKQEWMDENAILLAGFDLSLVDCYMLIEL